MASRFTILIDGGFFTKCFRHENKRFPSADDVEAIVSRILEMCSEIKDKELLRVFYYDAHPVLKQEKNPVTGTIENFAATPLARSSTSLHENLAVKSNFALRFGELKLFNWGAIYNKKKHSLIQSTGIVETGIDDWKPNFIQKGVDLKIGLDIAEMAFKKTVETIILFSGDTDLIPAMKLARKEGLRVITVVPGKSSLTKSLKEHSDDAIKVCIIRTTS